MEKGKYLSSWKISKV